MSKIIYPFAAIPNQILRSGHGAINVAVLAVLMSHGRSTASARTLANEIGCDRKSVFKAIAYWKGHGPKHGIFITTKGSAEGRNGLSTVVEIEITTCTENGTGAVETCTENGTPPVPKTEQVPVPKTEHIRRTLKKNPEEDVGRVVDKKGKPYIEGDPAFYDSIRETWRVRTYTGEWKDYAGDVKKNLTYR